MWGSIELQDRLLLLQPVDSPAPELESRNLRKLGTGNRTLETETLPNVDASWVALIPPRSFVADVTPPGSKSVANRALVCAALADGKSRIRGFARADDTKLLILALRKLGFRIEPAAPSDLIVDGGGVTAVEASLDLGNAGTSFRFAAAVAALGKGAFALDGDARMRERPIAGLVGGLRGVGGKIDYGGAAGFPPNRIA